jgi:hypothetical protein
MVCAMTDGFKRIEQEILAFSDKVAQCQDKDASTADFRDAYSRLNIAYNRYGHEKATLDATEQAALRKVFEDDRFMEGMGRVRVISEHVLQRGCAVLSYPDNSTFTITSASSAAAVFADRCVTLIDADGNPHRWDHPEQLGEVDRRLCSAMEKAKGPSD